MNTSDKYLHKEEIHNLKSPRILVPYLDSLFHPQSVIDVGCGIGTFLYVFKELGVSEVLGLDGRWVDKMLLKKYLKEEEFKEVNLENGFWVNKKFDLALCLEVGEHLNETTSEALIASLTSLSDMIIFSAAIPSQGGQNHINEQPFSYWYEKFKQKGYDYYDIIRDKLWGEKDVQWWYKQNVFLVAKQGIELSNDIRKKKLEASPNIYIHPELFYSKAEQLNDFINLKHKPRTYFKFFIKRLFRINAK